MYKKLQDALQSLSNRELLGETVHSASIVYEWLKGPQERKEREVTLVAEWVAVKAIQVILQYPHFGGAKGQGYMIYHRLGYIPRHIYQRLKKAAGRVVFQQAYAQNLLPKPSGYEHERPDDVNKIWAEDFTTVTLLGLSYPAAVVEDVFSKKYLGNCVQLRQNSELVARPIEMAIKENSNAGPEQFLLSDNGSQYVSDAHDNLLAKHDIVHKLIPACRPQYNGSIECGMRDIKSVFYNVFAKNDLKEFALMDTDPSAERKKLLDKISLSLQESIRRLNDEIPRPALGGVTAEDVYSAVAEEKRKLNAEYLEKEQMKEKVNRWSKSEYELVKEVLKKKQLSKKELLIKLYFFQKNPLRRISKLPRNVWTN